MLVTLTALPTVVAILSLLIISALTLTNPATIRRLRLTALRRDDDGFDSSYDTLIGCVFIALADLYIVAKRYRERVCLIALIAMHGQHGRAVGRIVLRT